MGEFQKYQKSNGSSDLPHCEKLETYLLLLWIEGQTVHIIQKAGLFPPYSKPEIDTPNISFRTSE